MQEHQQNHHGQPGKAGQQRGSGVLLKDKALVRRRQHIHFRDMATLGDVRGDRLD
jgi:hypothetical protein